MRFLLDQDVYAATARLLSNLGHEVVLAAQLSLSQADDSELLRIAHSQSRILVTRDRDFGRLVFVNDLGTGVLYLRRPTVNPKCSAQGTRKSLEVLFGIRTDEGFCSY